MSKRLITAVAMLGVVLGIGGYLSVHGTDFLSISRTMMSSLSYHATAPYDIDEELIEGQLP